MRSRATRIIIAVTCTASIALTGCGGTPEAPTEVSEVSEVSGTEVEERIGEAESDPAESSRGSDRDGPAEPLIGLGYDVTWKGLLASVAGERELSCIDDAIDDADLPDDFLDDAVMDETRFVGAWPIWYQKILGVEVGDNHWPHQVWRCLEPATAAALYVTVRLEELVRIQGVSVVDRDAACILGLPADADLAAAVSESLGTEHSFDDPEDGLAVLEELDDQVVDPILLACLSVDDDAEPATDSSGTETSDVDLFGQEALDALDHYERLAARLEDSDDAVFDITRFFDLVEEVAAVAESAGRHAEASDLRDRRQRLESPEVTDFGSAQAVPMVEIEGAILAGRAAAVADQINMGAEAARLRDMESKLSHLGFVREALAAHGEIVDHLAGATTVEELAEMAALEAGHIVQIAEVLEEFEFLNYAAQVYLSAARFYGLGAVVDGASSLDDEERVSRYEDASARATMLGISNLGEILAFIAAGG